MLNTKEVAQSLRKNGYKVTPQRLAVYEWLSHTQEHPTAEMLQPFAAKISQYEPVHCL